MSKLLLLSTPYSDTYDKMRIRSVGFGMPPIGISYIAGYLNSKGHKVKLVDLMYHENGMEGVLDLLKQVKPDIVGLTCTTTQVPDVLRIAGVVKRYNQAIKVVVGGPHPSALPIEIISYPDIDILVYGEGEEALVEIANGNNLDQIKGIYYKEGSEIKYTQARPLIEDLDSLPFPLYEQLPLLNYSLPYVGRTLALISGRGCALRCTFCASGVINRHCYRIRSPANFVDEIELLYRKFKLNNFNFQDDTFTLHKDRVYDICELIRKRNLRIEWSCSTRVNNVSFDLLNKMKEAGCRIIHLGIESGSPEILKKIKKGVILQEARKAVCEANKAGLDIYVFFILGLPFETKQTLKQTIEFACSLDVDYAQFCYLTPLPGTEIWDMIKEGKILRCTAKEWSDYKRYGEPIVESDTLSKETLIYYFRLAHKKFYFRPRYILRKIIKLRRWQDIRNHLRLAQNLLRLSK